MFIRDSRRRYISYPYSELILITDLCLFRTPVGVTELILIQNLYLTDLCLFRTPVGVTELIHVFQILYMYYRTYTCPTELILVLWNLYWYYGTYTDVTKLILVFQILFLYEGTRKYDKSEQIRLIQIHISYGH